MRKLVPFNDRIVVKPMKSRGVTPGGIALPDCVRDMTYRGEVIAVGPGRVLASGERCKSQANPGDEIVYDAHAGEEFKLDGDEFRIICESDISARIV